MTENKTKKAIICPSCGKLISANSEKCFYCGLKNPGRFGLGSFVQKIFHGNIGFVQAVIYFCVGLYIISLLIDPRAILQPAHGFLSILSPSGKSLFILGMTGEPFMAAGRWWTLITAIYLHGGLLHILFNVLWIRQLGPMVESFFGTSRLILIFTISGVVGFILSNSMGIKFTIGASGSIFGLLGALIYYGRARGGVFGQIVYRQLLIWAVVLFMFGFFFPGINNFAHLGGFIGGYLSANVLGYQEKKSETSGHRKLAALAIGITVFAFILNFIIAL